MSMSGWWSWDASSTAGYQCAGAEPEVAITMTGDRVDFAIPSAKNAADRSSTITHVFRPGAASQASARGEDREPGEITA